MDPGTKDKSTASGRFVRHSSVQTLVDRRRFIALLGRLRRAHHRVDRRATPAQRVTAAVDALREMFPSVRFAIRLSPKVSDGAVIVQHATHSITPPASDALTISEAGLALSGAEPPWPEAIDIRIVREYELCLSEAEPPGAADGFDCAIWQERTLIGVVLCEFDTSRPLPAYLHEIVAATATQLGASLEVYGLGRESQHLRDYLDRVLEHANIPVLVLSKDRNVRVASGAIERITGIRRDEMLGRDLLRCVPVPDRVKLLARITNVLHGRSERPFELPLTSNADAPGGDATPAHLEFSMVPVVDQDGGVAGVLAIGRDLTEVRELEDQVIQAEKLATLGQLAAGIVHEINNPLTSISVYGEYLLTKLRQTQGDEADVQRMQRILESADRIMHFSRNVLAYARPTSEQPGPVIVADALDEALDLCQHVLREARVEVSRHYASDVPAVMAVRSQLHQVFVNLITNACNAMPEAGGNIRIGVLGTAGNDVRISIEDDGIGISDQQLEQVFQPFYSTKPKGEGTGLGLSIVQNIISQHGGKVDIDSELGSGTRISITLPRIL